MMLLLFGCYFFSSLFCIQNRWRTMRIELGTLGKGIKDVVAPNEATVCLFLFVVNNLKFQ